MKPSVSVIVPCYNESKTITALLDSLRNQTYSIEKIEVIIADGMSTDDTRSKIHGFQSRHPELAVRIVDNHARHIPSALNLAIKAARGDVIVRVDAHCVPYHDYIDQCVKILEETGAANVGGIWEIRPSIDSGIAKGIALAAAHPLGAGDAKYRITGKRGPVDTVPFGAFPRRWFDKVGLFNEELLSNEDYEFNARLRKAGGVVWMDPEIRTVYFSRSNLKQLARQYWRYGYWKAAMLRVFPDTLRWRQVVPPLFVLTTLFSALAGIAIPSFRIVLAAILAAYVAVTGGVGIYQALRLSGPGRAAGFTAALWTMHIAWGSGFLWSIVERSFGRTTPRPKQS